MQRNPTETFVAYKIRRAAANLAVKRINWDSKGGSKNTRAGRVGSGTYGKNLIAAISARQLTVAISQTHKAFVARMNARALARTGQIEFAT